MTGPSAAVDIGTNSTRLLLRHADGRLERHSRVTGLGRGVGASGHISDVGREMTLATLKDYRHLIDTAGVVAARVVMTAVGRDASNAAEFSAAAGQVLGMAVEVISGEEEARLSYLGATSDLDDERWTVVDIGGGSTEIVSAGGGVSLPVGSVKVTDRHLGGRPVRARDLDAARQWLEEMVGSHPSAPDGVVGVAGTWTSLAAMTRPDQPVHHSRLSAEVLEEWIQRLARMSIAETSRLAGLDSARAPVILGGAIVAAAALRALGVDECLVSERDLLDGILAGPMTSRIRR